MSFYAYYIEGDNLYRERFGLDFEDFEIGQRFRHRPGVTLSQQDNVDESLDTLNAAMVHYDNKYASQTTWGRELMVSSITLQRLTGMASKTFGRKERIAGFDEIAMTGPIFGGDTLYSESEITGLEDTDNPDLGLVKVLCRGINQDNVEVARVNYRVRVWRAGRHPEDTATGATRRVPAEQPRFLAHRQEGDGSYTEQVGMFYEDCRPGDQFIHWPRRTMRRDEGIEHAVRSLELNPQYHDLDWVATYGEDEFRFTEAWVITAATAMTTRTFGRVVANLGWTGIEFGASVAPGDTMESRSTIFDARESKSRPNEGILGVETSAFNQRGEQVLTYRRRLLVYKRNAQTPYEAAGY